MIFGLTSSCCGSPIQTRRLVGTAKHVIECTQCLREDTAVISPCCKVEVYTLGYDEIHCEASKCASIWAHDGSLVFMDYTWSWNEGVDV